MKSTFARRLATLPPLIVAAGNNDACIRDASGEVVANCNGYESRAVVIAAALNEMAMSLAYYDMLKEEDRDL